MKDALGHGSEARGGGGDGSAAHQSGVESARSVSRDALMGKNNPAVTTGSSKTGGWGSEGPHPYGGKYWHTLMVLGNNDPGEASRIHRELGKRAFEQARKKNKGAGGYQRW